MSETLFHGSCHCGAVRLGTNYWPEQVSECNCSICLRYGARWAYFQRREIMVDAAEQALEAYSCSDHVIRFIRCKHCGCITHYEDVEQTPESRLALNVRMFPVDDWQAIPVRKFDGAVSWKPLELERWPWN